MIQRGYLKEFVRKDNGRIEDPSHIPQKIASSAIVRAEGQDIADRTPISTIFGGPTGGRDSNRARKAHNREARNTPGVFFVDLASRPKKKLK